MIRRLMIAAALCSSIPAFADEATARKSFEAGERAYNLGEFSKAVELFKKAYEEWPEPAFLFNMAQTYRQQGDCKQALFFYKRFLALKLNDTKKPIKPELKKEVDSRIVELEECTRREIANKPPDTLDNGSGTSTASKPLTPTTQGTQGTQANPTKTTPTNGTSTSSTANADNEQSDTGEEEEETPTPQPVSGPKMITVRGYGGAAMLNAGELETKLQFAATLVGGYPLTLNPNSRLELGAAFMFTPVPYTTTMNDHGTGGVIDVLANVGASFTVAPKLSVRGEGGIGVLLFTGLSKPGNPFTMNGDAASGALSALAVRAAASADYAVTPNVVLTATPIAFTYSPAPSGLDSSIASLTTLSFLVGIGYQQ